MKTFKNCTELTSKELFLIDGGNTPPSGNASDDLLFSIAFTVGFLKDSLKYSMTVSGALFGRTW